MKDTALKILSVLLLICILPTLALAASGGVSLSARDHYEMGLEQLCSGSLMDEEQLNEILAQFEQAGAYSNGIQYKMFTEALLYLLNDDEDSMDQALSRIQIIAADPMFVSHYIGNVDQNWQSILPDLDKLQHYIEARKYALYGDMANAMQLFKTYSVLDATQRAMDLEGAWKLEQYNTALSLMKSSSASSLQEAKSLLESLGSYKDSKTQLQACLNRIAALATPKPTQKPTQAPAPTQKPLTARTVYGAWSSWSTAPVSNSSTRDVETRTTSKSTPVTKYKYNRWLYTSSEYGANTPTYNEYTGSTYMGNGRWEYKTTTSPIPYYKTYNYSHDCYKDPATGRWFNQEIVTEYEYSTVTEYRYRTISVVYE